MKYTNQEYAEKALEANNEGKLLIINDENKLEIIDIAKTESDIIFVNNAQKESLIQESNEKIAILQDTIDLDMAEDGDVDKLKKWRKYRVLLSRLDTNVENMELPEKPI